MQMVASYMAMWPEDIPLHIYSDKVGTSTDRMIYHNLEHDPDYVDFVHRFDPKNGKQIFGSKIYARDANVAVKFCHKVFAVTDYPQLLNNRLGEADYWIWIDADVIWKKEIDENFLQQVCRRGYEAVYLGRRNWHHSECGFVAYPIVDGRNRTLDKLRFLYTSGLIFGLPEWHDSYIFDVVRRSLEMQGYQYYDLADEVNQSCSDIHVWPKTILGSYAEHNKGPVKKIEAYGEIM